MSSDAQRNSIRRYRKTQDQIVITIPKGAREAVKSHASAKGKSVNSLIVELLEKDIGKSMRELADKYKDNDSTPE